MKRRETAEAGRYREVRGLSRGLAVLRALNGLAGGLGSAVELSRATGLHRTTVKRLLETLKAEGVVDHRDEGGLYALTFEVRRLAEGYVGSDWVDRIAAPAMRAHLRALSWPSDLATPDGGDMVVRESTHRASMLSQHRATIGVRIPMLVSSLGRAWLAHCADEEREATLAMLRARTDAAGEQARDRAAVRRLGFTPASSLNRSVIDVGSTALATQARVTTPAIESARRDRGTAQAMATIVRIPLGSMRRLSAITKASKPIMPATNPVVTMPDAMRASWLTAGRRLRPRT